jgi:hypothetical protein
VVAVGDDRRREIVVAQPRPNDELFKIVNVGCLHPFGVVGSPGSFLGREKRPFQMNAEQPAPEKSTPLNPLP